MTATLGVVAPQKRGVVSDEDREAIARAVEARDAADTALRAAVLTAVANGASVRELDALPGISGATVSRWKREGLAETGRTND